jgi:NTP pyrophosphatase (non-canonical NTP hydrolase)
MVSAKPMNDSLSALSAEILRFRDERDWAQFHTPRNLAAALAIEAAELQEIMLWKTDAQVRELFDDPQRLATLRHELADVLIFALLLCDTTDIEPAAAIREKLELNAEKYPAERARGRATKYTDL